MTRRRISDPRAARQKPESMEARLRGLAEALGINTLREWDVLSFLYRHGTSLGSVERIASLLCYGAESVEEALDRLEAAGLIQPSRELHGVRLYRYAASGDPRRESCFTELAGLVESRAGRLLLRKCLRLPDRSQSAPARDSLRFG